jgi:hypothetical protein
VGLPAELPVELLVTLFHLLAVVSFRAPVPGGDAARGGEIPGFRSLLNVALAGAGRLDVLAANAPEFGRAGALANVDSVAQQLQLLGEHGAVDCRPVLLAAVQLEGLDGLYFFLCCQREIEGEVVSVKIGRGEAVLFIRAGGVMLEAGEE